MPFALAFIPYITASAARGGGARPGTEAWKKQHERDEKSIKYDRKCGQQCMHVFTQVGAGGEAYYDNCVEQCRLEYGDAKRAIYKRHASYSIGKENSNAVNQRLGTRSLNDRRHTAPVPGTVTSAHSSGANTASGEAKWLQKQAELALCNSWMVRGDGENDNDRESGESDAAGAGLLNQHIAGMKLHKQHASNATLASTATASSASASASVAASDAGSEISAAPSLETFISDFGYRSEL